MQVTSLEKGGRPLSYMQQSASAAYESQWVLIETLISHGFSLSSITFDREVGYDFPVSGLTDDQQAMYGPLFSKHWIRA